MKSLKSILYVLCSVVLAVWVSACTDDDTFTVSPSARLTFSCDTVSLDTVFSKVPTSTRTMWVYNNNKQGVRCNSIALENGNQTGFRINVNGVYLGPTQGYQLSNEEIHKGDSLRIFVEATLPTNDADQPMLVSDNLVFNLESGTQQRVNLRAWAWDAEMLKDLIVISDTTIDSSKPTVIYGGITVKEGATLTLPAGKTLYMHSGANIDVYGKLLCQGQPGNEVVLRGDRLDNMFDYLKYDGVSGQWGGIRLHSNSFDNVLDYTDVHATGDAIVCDSSNTERQKLILNASTIHNAKGDGVNARNCKIDILNTQISNTLGDCLNIKGGTTMINNSTIAQFYPFDASRGDALYLSDDSTVVAPLDFTIRNSIVTGYASDVIMVYTTDTTKTANVLFENCLLRTPEVSDTLMCRDIIWENEKDTTVAGWKNFVNVDTSLLRYDFRLKETSLAIDAANPDTSLPTDRNATLRDDKPDMGCYESEKKSDEEE